MTAAINRPIPLLVEDVPWDTLNVYELLIYPDHLLVTTNATYEQFIRAVDILRASHDNGEFINIENALWQLGFCGVAATKPHTIKVVPFLPMKPPSNDAINLFLIGAGTIAIAVATGNLMLALGVWLIAAAVRPMTA